MPVLETLIKALRVSELADRMTAVLITRKRPTRKKVGKADGGGNPFVATVLFLCYRILPQHTGLTEPPR